MKAIRHFGIVVSDLDRALGFYEGLLCLKVSKRMEESGEYLSRITGLANARATTVKLTADDGNLVELLLFQSHPRMPSAGREMCGIGASHVAFTVDNVEDVFRRLSKAGIAFHAPPQVSPDGYAKVTFCKDPDGTLIELVQVLQSS